MIDANDGWDGGWPPRPLPPPSFRQPGFAQGPGEGGDVFLIPVNEKVRDVGQPEIRIDCLQVGHGIRCFVFPPLPGENTGSQQNRGEKFRLSAGDVREPIVDVDDIADVAVSALTEDRHDGQLCEITGPRLLSFDEAAADLSNATGREVRYLPITFDQFHAAMTEIGGQTVADVFTDICREVLDGRNALLGDGVQRALGRKPRDFADFCRAAAASGAWNQAA